MYSITIYHERYHVIAIIRHYIAHVTWQDKAFFIRHPIKAFQLEEWGTFKGTYHHIDVRRKAKVLQKWHSLYRLRRRFRFVTYVRFAAYLQTRFFLFESFLYFR